MAWEQGEDGGWGGGPRGRGEVVGVVSVVFRRWSCGGLEDKSSRDVLNSSGLLRSSWPLKLLDEQQSSYEKDLESKPDLKPPDLKFAGTKRRLNERQKKILMAMWASMDVDRKGEVGVRGGDFDEHVGLDGCGQDFFPAVDILNPCPHFRKFVVYCLCRKSANVLGQR